MKEFWGKFISGFINGVCYFFISAICLGIFLSQMALLITCVNAILYGTTVLKGVGLAVLVMVDFGALFGIINTAD